MVSAAGGQALLRVSSVGFNKLYAGVIAIGVANAVAGRMIALVKLEGIVPALMRAFDISVLVWVAAAIAVHLIHKTPLRSVSRRDRFVAICACTLFAVPLSSASWIGLSALALYLTRSAAAGSVQLRAGWVLLAITVPMFWSRLLFEFISEWILLADAWLVAQVLGTRQVGNTVQLADGTGFLYIASSCSSMANVSLAILCWTLFVQTSDQSRRVKTVRWCLLACLAMVCVNVTRISLVGLYHEHFDLIHGQVGATIAAWTSLLLMLGVCSAGIRQARA
jgi:exosortase/archaeosortase family protein